MKLNLRKARKLQQKILKYLESNTISASVSIMVTAEAKEIALKLAKQRDSFQNNLNNHITLLALSYKIRDKIGASNNNSGINSLLTEKALLEKKVVLITNYISSEPALTVDELGVLLKAKAKQLESGDRFVKIKHNADCLYEPDLKIMQTTCKECSKRIEDIDDELAQKNLGTNILLDEKDVELLSLFEIV